VTATRPHAPITNHSAAFGWGFMAIWLGMLALFTGLFVREGGFHQFSRDIEIAILSVFWLGGLAGVVQVLSNPLIRVERIGDDLIVTERWPLSSRRHRLPAGTPPPATVAAERDSDGDTYYACRLILPDGRAVYIFQSPVRAEAEHALARLIRLAA
jgi:hypothetical protein